jgi:ATP-dependent Zn protease
LTHSDIEFAYDHKTIGVDLTSRIREKEDLQITAVHEGGHVLVAYYTKEADKIHKVTIIAKGQSGKKLITLYEMKNEFNEHNAGH